MTMGPVSLFFCGFLQQDEEEVEELKTKKLSESSFRSCHSILESLPITCSCEISQNTIFALTKKFLYYSYKNTLMRHSLINSLKKLKNKTENYDDFEVLNTGNLPIKKLNAGSDFVTVTFKNNNNESVTLVLSDDGSSFTLEIEDGIVVCDFIYGKKFGLLCTIDNKLIRIEQKCSKDKDIGMTPLRLPISTSVQMMSCGKEHALVLTSEHKVLAIGGGSRGQLGNGCTDYASKLEVVEALEPLKFQGLSTGGWHSLVLSDDGDLYGWGWNESGQVGSSPCQSSLNGTEVANEENISKLLFLPELVDTPLSERFVSMSTGSRHSAAVTSQGVLYTWGWNGYGQLCHGDQDNRFSPCKVICYEKKITRVYCSDWATLVCVM